ncbi:MAG: amidohydrolase family protein [Candidatus Latescibacteria bacterium]|nr:amidohydrolase family protein [Candidatus Latescibacterota bacterium]
MTKPADLLVKHGVVLTLDGQRRILADGAVAILGDHILAVGQSAELEREYAPCRTIDARGGVVQPGFVDCHVHLSQHLGRGTIPDLWPESREHEQWLPYWTQINEEEARCSALLACMEMVRNGTTCFCDNGGRFAGELNAEVVAQVGLRGAISEVCWDQPPHPAVAVGDTDTCLRRLEALARAFPKRPDACVWAAVSMAGMGLCSDRLLVEGKRLADQLGTLMEMHQSFGPEDVARYRAHARGKSAVAHLADLGILGPNLQLVHMIHTVPDEIPLLATSGTSVVHCPAASTRMGMGVSRTGRMPELLRAGVNLALGSDSGNYSDFLDVGRQLYLAATIHREARGEQPCVSAEQALEMATRNGARALGVDSWIGSLELGKKADLVIHDYGRPEWRPGLDPVTSLVYSAQSSGVHTAIVDGRIVLEGGHFPHLDEERLYQRIDQAARALYTRMGWVPRHRWPLL